MIFLMHDFELGGGGGGESPDIQTPYSHVRQWYLECKFMTSISLRIA